MLKIAEGIDLKELEKYGFKYKQDEDYEYWEITNELETYRIMFVAVWDRKIHNLGADDTLYDLIQAGIVVKEWLYAKGKRRNRFKRAWEVWI